MVTSTITPSVNSNVNTERTPFYQGEKISKINVVLDFLAQPKNTVKVIGTVTYWWDHFYFQLPSISHYLPLFLRSNPVALQHNLQRVTNQMGDIKNALSSFALPKMVYQLYESTILLGGKWWHGSKPVNNDSNPVEPKKEKFCEKLVGRAKKISDSPEAKVIRAVGEVINGLVDSVSYWAKYTQVKPATVQAVIEGLGKGLGIASIAGAGVSTVCIAGQLAEFGKIYEKAETASEGFLNIVKDKKTPVRVLDIAFHTSIVALGVFSAYFMYMGVRIPTIVLKACTTGILIPNTIQHFWTHFFDPMERADGYTPKFNGTWYNKNEAPQPKVDPKKTAETETKDEDNNNNNVDQSLNSGNGGQAAVETTNNDNNNTSQGQGVTAQTGSNSASNDNNNTTTTTSSSLRRPPEDEFVPDDWENLFDEEPDDENNNMSSLSSKKSSFTPRTDFNQTPKQAEEIDTDLNMDPYDIVRTLVTSRIKNKTAPATEPNETTGAAVGPETTQE